jgi:simple sugar transport system substrate-binding protein
MRNIAKIMLGAASAIALTAGAAAAQDEGWCSDQTIRVFSGGPAGGAFNSIIDRGALQAAADTGANVEIVYSEWDFDKGMSRSMLNFSE